MGYAAEIIGALGFTPERQIASLSLLELIRHIVSLHHRYQKEALAELGLHLTLAECHFEANKVHIVQLREELAGFCAELHRLLRRDEEVVFTRLERLEEPYATANPELLDQALKMVAEDHLRLRNRLTELQLKICRLGRLPRVQRLQRALADLALDLDERAALQDQALFPRALRLAHLCAS